MTVHKILTVVAGTLILAACSQSQNVSFSRDVLPLLQRECAVCHTPGGVGFGKTGFTVVNYASVMKGTNFGPVVVPSSSVSSTIMRLLEHKADPSINMPKEFKLVIEQHNQVLVPSQAAKQLAPRELDLVRKWIDEGALNN